MKSGEGKEMKTPKALEDWTVEEVALYFEFAEAENEHFKGDFVVDDAVEVRRAAITRNAITTQAITMQAVAIIV